MLKDRSPFHPVQPGVFYEKLEASVPESTGWQTAVRLLNERTPTPLPQPPHRAQLQTHIIFRLINTIPANTTLHCHKLARLSFFWSVVLPLRLSLLGWHCTDAHEYALYWHFTCTVSCILKRCSSATVLLNNNDNKVFKVLKYKMSDSQFLKRSIKLPLDIVYQYYHRMKVCKKMEPWDNNSLELCRIFVCSKSIHYYRCYLCTSLKINRLFIKHL